MEVMLNDGAKKIFLNADGKKGDIIEELKAFLDYVAGRPSEDAFVKKLESAVEKAKKNRKWRREYMTLLMRDRQNYKKGKIDGKIEGKREGKMEGQKMMLELIQKLMADGRLDDIAKIKDNEEDCQKLYREYNILDR